MKSFWRAVVSGHAYNSVTPTLSQFPDPLSLPYIRLARLKFKLTNQHSAGGKKILNSFIGDVNLPPIILKPTNAGELESICSMFASGKAPGYDNISMRVIKHSFDLISAPLTDIINLSLQKGTFPDKLKLTKVIPIYKANNPSLFTNYRPISLLSNFSNSNV